ncbi:hypothetical protein KDA_00960 [Dictyobacter alpinus]|uniref:Uncharacterized protein n=1 Tax=Dictyobacter alpinus TaxID=2014873 RepID=A0A402AZT0_9CHLR|nr:hypothetical protein KDA_00960 [Dictyobacter alpinus]
MVGETLDKAQQICDTTATRDRDTKTDDLLVNTGELRFVGTLTTEEWKAEQQLEHMNRFHVPVNSIPDVRVRRSQQ